VPVGVLRAVVAIAETIEEKLRLSALETLVELGTSSLSISPFSLSRLSSERAILIETLGRAVQSFTTSPSSPSPAVSESSFKSSSTDHTTSHLPSPSSSSPPSTALSLDNG
jgi:hypothetical protein